METISEAAEKSAVEVVVCRSCGYAGVVETFDPCMGVYNDIRCPNCGSTNCDHNAEYRDRLFKAMKASAHNAKVRVDE